MNKSQKITTIVISSLFVIFSIVLFLWYFGGNYAEFYNVAREEFEIAGLSEGFTPQGIGYDSASETYLTCGYMKDGTASRVYVIKDGETEKYFTLKLNGDDYNGHAGGIATNGVKVWISGDGMVHCFNFADIADVENGETIEITGSFESHNGADFVTIEENALWVGEFHRAGKYDTDESHFIETDDGQINKAISFKFTIDNNTDTGIASNIARAGLSTPSLVQGMVISQNKIVLSTSYSLPDSHIYTYNDITNDISNAQGFLFEGQEIPLYVLSEKDLLNDLTAPCMSEELVLVNDRVYVLFESACKKYVAFTREPLRNVYSFAI
ncbi:MAG: hypothetical protein ACI4R8_00310 [Candidatus Caccovivens sp.]